MADSDRGNRPLSPHLSIYRPQMSSVSSIFVRITGISLALGFVLITWWLLAAATDAGAFAFVDGVLTSLLGKLILIGSLWALWYHLLGGVRHLIWDMGYGFELRTADLMGWIMIIGSFVMTALSVWCLGGAS